MQVKSIEVKQAAKVAAVMSLIGFLILTYPLAAAAFVFHVNIPHHDYAVLLFVPFFYALATYFLIGLGCMLYNFAARRIGGIRVEIS
ncbi:MAG TPA: hypothetical protein VFB33_09565 [Candidatus Binataceae bacterium]|jgi:hypothetical protein|nr:hypothetical protein [Candidatus Binataceae bacterium]